MKYAKEVIDLLGAFPGRAFKMAQIVRYINPRAPSEEREAIRQGVRRAVYALEDAGVVVIDKPPHATNAAAKYAWK